MVTQPCEPFTGLPRQTMIQEMLRAVMIHIGWLLQSQNVPVPVPESKRWVAVVIALVLMIAVTVASAINPRRGHRD